MKSLKTFHTFHTSSLAHDIRFFSSIDQLQTQLSQLDRSNEPWIVLGGGSNVLFTKDYQGTVLVNDIKGIVKESESDHHVRITFGSGENWHEIVQYTIDHNWFGIENLALIPGTVGAAPIQNIGAYGVELKDYFHKLTAFNTLTKEVVTFHHHDCKFGYRDSFFKHQPRGTWIILSVTLNLNKNFTPQLTYKGLAEAFNGKKVVDLNAKDIFNEVVSIRESKLPNPSVLGNAGSFFKNPIISKVEFEKLSQRFPSIPWYPAGEDDVKLPAAWLIDQAGWKGFREGSVGVHENQALVLVNFGGAHGNEIWELAQKIILDIELKFSITLNPEVNVF